MKNFLMTFIILLIFASVILPAGEGEKYGKEITLAEKTEISDILTNPDEFLGKIVLIEGEVLDVCAHAGCWMEIASDKKDRKIRVKVKDGDIVFPVEAKGKKALVEGEVYAIEMDEEKAKAYFEHMAEDAGKKFDPSTVTGPVTVYQIKGFGAEVNKK